MSVKPPRRKERGYDDQAALQGRRFVPEADWSVMFHEMMSLEYRSGECPVSAAQLRHSFPGSLTHA
jgi:hypothetical protein